MFILAETNLNILSKSTAVVITCCLCIPNCLKKILVSNSIHFLHFHRLFLFNFYKYQFINLVSIYQFSIKVSIYHTCIQIWTSINWRYRWRYRSVHLQYDRMWRHEIHLKYPNTIYTYYIFLTRHIHMVEDSGEHPCGVCRKGVGDNSILCVVLCEFIKEGWREMLISNAGVAWREIMSYLKKIVIEPNVKLESIPKFWYLGGTLGAGGV